MPNEEFGGNENNTSKPSNPGDNTVDPGDDAKTLAVTRKILSSSLDGKHYSSKSQTQQWIVIHNTGGGTAESAYNWFNNPSNTYQTSAHYCVDDKQIIQCLEDNWKGHHAGGSGVQYNDKWRPSNSEDCTNSNSIGIEVADWGGDYKGEQFGKAIENAIAFSCTLTCGIEKEVAKLLVGLVPTATQAKIILWMIFPTRLADSTSDHHQELLIYQYLQKLLINHFFV